MSLNKQFILSLKTLVQSRRMIISLLRLVSVGDVGSSSNQYVMRDAAVSETIFNRPVDVLENVDTTALSQWFLETKVEVNQVQSVSGNTLLW